MGSNAARNPVRPRPSFGAVGLAVVCCLAPFAAHVDAAQAGAAQAGDHAAGFARIDAADIDAHVRFFASPLLEGRDTPSRGLDLAAAYIARRFRAVGLQPAGDSLERWKQAGRAGAPADHDAAPVSGGGSQGGPSADAPAAAATATFLRPWQRDLPEVDVEGSRLVLMKDAGDAQAFVLEEHFVPVPGLEGEAIGELVFVGFGIASRDDGLDELAGLDLKGKVALVLEGEPAHDKKLDGPELSRASSVYAKVGALAERGAAAAVLVSRPGEAWHDHHKPRRKQKDAAEEAPLDFRHTFASWVGEEDERPPAKRLPVVETTTATASRLLGEDVAALRARIESSFKPVRAKSKKGPRVSVGSRTKRAPLWVDNVVAVMPGADPRLASEWVVLGAHYDHIGVDQRGRIGLGADDNASGTAALLELAEALAVARPARSVMFAAFSGEEDGLLGSKALARALPMPKESIAAMINLDMIGRGDPKEVAIIGLVQNPALEDVLQRARKLEKTGIERLVLRQGEELFQRSDHWSFHELGVPVLFFFEGLPIEKNGDYHTWRDVPERLDWPKILHTTRFVYSTAWLLTTDPSRPPAPRG
jgi:hypothetical protein